MCNVVYDSAWENLIWIWLELECPKCNKIEDSKSIFEYNDLPLLEYVELIREAPDEYCVGPPILSCDTCEKTLNKKIVRKVNHVKYIQPVTRMKKLRW
jgi:phage FluMu protein Com